MAEDNHSPSYEEDAGGRRDSALVLYQKLGQIEGALVALTSEMRQQRIETSAQRRVLEDHLVSDTKWITDISARLEYLKTVVERIRKPVDAFMSVRNFLIGLLSIVAATGAAWAYLGGAFHVAASAIVGLFHTPQ